MINMSMIMMIVGTVAKGLGSQGFFVKRGKHHNMVSLETKLIIP
jgi:hypothetical protein